MLESEAPNEVQLGTLHVSVAIVVDYCQMLSQFCGGDDLFRSIVRSV